MDLLLILPSEAAGSDEGGCDDIGEVLPPGEVVVKRQRSQKPAGRTLS